MPKFATNFAVIKSYTIAYNGLQKCCTYGNIWIEDDNWAAEISVSHFWKSRGQVMNLTWDSRDFLFSHFYSNLISLVSNSHKLSTSKTKNVPYANKILKHGRN